MGNDNGEVKIIKGMADHLCEVDDSIIEEYIKEAELEVNSYSLRKKDYYNILVRYLAIHKATINERRPNSYGVGGELNVSFNSPQGEDLKSTEYGQEYLRTLRKATGKRIVIL